MAVESRKNHWLHERAKTRIIKYGLALAHK